MTDVQAFVPHVSDRTEHRIELTLGHGQTASFTGDDLDRPLWIVCLHDDGPLGESWRTVGAPARSKSAATARVKEIGNGAYRWGRNAPRRIVNMVVVAVPALDV